MVPDMGNKHAEHSITRTDPPTEPTCRTFWSRFWDQDSNNRNIRSKYKADKPNMPGK